MNPIEIDRDHFFSETGASGEWPVLVTVPHAGVKVPADIETDMLATGEPPAALLRRLMDGSDPFTDRIYDWPETRARFGTHLSRFVVDLNRSRQDMQENGVIKKTDFNRIPLYRPEFSISLEDQENRLIRYWDPLYRDIEAALTRGGFKLLIDGHSMSPQGPVIGPDGGAQRPAICLGVSVMDTRGRRFTCSQSVIDAAAEAAEQGILAAFPDWPASQRVGIDQPFDGGNITHHFSSPQWDWAIPAIMVECNRNLYLNATTLLPKPVGLEHCRQITRAITAAALKVLDA